MSEATNTTAYDSLPDAVTEIFGEEATAERGYDLLTVDVPVGSWIAALEIARDKLGCTYFDWLSAVDEPGTGFRVCAHVVALEGRTVRRLLLRTTVPHSAPAVPSAVEIYAGAQWHERETHEMFGVDFTGHPHLAPLLLPEGFEGHPLRKDFVLAARVAKAWPGAKEPGESDHGGPKRRQMLPPGVPDPNEWGPLKGQLPPAPPRPARTPRAAGSAADRPPRRARSVTEGSTTQATETTTPPPEGTASRPPRRARSVTEGSASQAADASTADASTEGASTAGAAPATHPEPDATTPPTAGSAEGGAGAPAARPAPAAPEAATPATEDMAPPAAGPARPAPAAPLRSADAPWHHARPAFRDEEAQAESEAATKTGASADTEADAAAAADAAADEAVGGDAAAAKEPGRQAEGSADGDGDGDGATGATPDPDRGSDNA
ncbi:NADH-quinone oxidoreductase subunit C [Streptomyces flavidovirens]|uniref:NADH-quinone oxidoreductase subunit C n=1 Tax=Streptomyces flavidovirens TaxID=67298 RepID=UPI00341D8207